MGMSLVGVDKELSCNWTGSYYLTELAVSYGWEPSGTMRVPMEEEDWWGDFDDDRALQKLDEKYGRGGYFSNDGFIVTRVDAGAFADA